MEIAISTDIITKTSRHIRDLFQKHIPSSLLYHNLEHTLNVVSAFKEIGVEEGLTEREMEIVELAAWFHDTGFALRYDGHEVEGAWIARRYLLSEGYSMGDINVIIQCILSTKCGRKPKGKLQKVLCDADLYHLSGMNYPDMAERLRQEWALRGKRYSDEEWKAENQMFLESHTFYTEYGKTVLEPLKRINMQKYLV